MARLHAHLLTSVWSDPDWTALSQSAQRAYLLLLSQPKLNMVGMLDYLPSRWARLASDTTPASVGEAIDELEASRFVLIDHDTDELLIRSLVRHEASPSKVANPRWLAGLWRAWESIDSRQLRDAVLNGIPTAVWDSPKVKPPAAAQTSRSAQKLLTETSSRTNGQNVPHEPLTTNHEPDAVADSKQPGNSRGDPTHEAAAVDNSTSGVFDQALDLLVARELDRNPTRGPSQERHAAGVRRGKRADHVTKARDLLRANPNATPAELAELLEPTPVLAAKTDPLDGQQQAFRARAERHLRVARGEGCQACNDTGWTLDEDGTAVECRHP